MSREILEEFDKLPYNPGPDALKQLKLAKEKIPKGLLYNECIYPIIRKLDMRLLTLTKMVGINLSALGILILCSKCNLYNRNVAAATLGLAIFGAIKNGIKHYNYEKNFDEEKQRQIDLRSDERNLTRRFDRKWRKSGAISKDAPIPEILTEKEDGKSFLGLNIFSKFTKRK